MIDGTLTRLSQAKFWILLVLLIPSIICSILILIYFYHKRRNILLDQHLIIVLVIISLLQVTTDIPFVMDYYQRGTVIFASNTFCLWWNWWEYSLDVVLLYVMAWGSIERHLLIFHRTIMTTKLKRLLFHFSPMLIACLYPLVFCSVIILFNSCQNQWDYNTLLCLLPCYFTDQPAIISYDFLGNLACPTLIIVMANLCLIFRVFWQRRHRHAAWRRQYKLTRQLLLVAILYIVTWLPLTFTGLITILTQSFITTDIQVNYLLFLVYMVPILIPFMSLSFLPDFRKTVFKRQQAVILPVIQ